MRYFSELYLLEFFFSIAPNSHFILTLFSFSFFLLHHIICVALSCQLQMKSRLCLVLALSYRTCYASFDILSSCPRMTLSEERPNTAPLLHIITQHWQNSSCRPHIPISRLFPLQLLVNVTFIYCLKDTEMQLWWVWVLKLKRLFI